MTLIEDITVIVWSIVGKHCAMLAGFTWGQGLWFQIVVWYLLCSLLRDRPRPPRGGKLT